jgi:predicted transcriptional regulator
MSTKNESPRSVREALKELVSVRDEAHLQVHLLSMEARERWKELETSLDGLERKINQGGEKATEAMLAGVRSLTHTVKDFLKNHAASSSELSAPVRSIMSKTVRSCSANDPLNHAAQVLWETNCGAAPVVAADQSLIGMITDRDICMACYTQGRALWESTVESAMSKQVYSCSPDHPIQRVLEIMSTRRVRRVPVTTESGHIAGVVALADVARWVQSLHAGRVVACDALVSTLAAISVPQIEKEPTASAAE